MPCHVIFLSIIVDDCGFRIIVLFILFDCIVELVCPLTQLTNRLWEDSLRIWVFPLRPIILVSHICPSNLLVESVPFVFTFDVGLNHILLVKFIFINFLFLVELFSTIQVGSVRLLPINV